MRREGIKTGWERGGDGDGRDVDGVGWDGMGWDRMDWTDRTGVRTAGIEIGGGGASGLPAPERETGVHLPLNCQPHRERGGCTCL